MADPDGYLAGLERVGWKLGTERVEALLARLGDPQRAYATIHVVGTNGKSSTTRMIAALLAAGREAWKTRPVGAMTSPHRLEWRERTEVAGRPIEPEAWGRAVAAVAAADPTDLGATQFEVAAAASFWALREAGVDVAVVEAGLGGRLDATNVLDSTVSVLSGIGLDHTDWLGDSELEIAAEKLAVLRPGSSLVVGRCSGAVAELAAATASERGARLVWSNDSAIGDRPGAPYLRRNLALAVAAVREFGVEVGDGEIASAAGIFLPGRFEVIAGEPVIVLDAAHNSDGARALAEALAAADPAELPRPRIGCVGLLADKDAAAVLGQMLGHLDQLVCTAISPPSGSGRVQVPPHTPDGLVKLSIPLGFSATAVADPSKAIADVIALAMRRRGTAVLFGSHYLLNQLWTVKRARCSSK